MGIGPKAESNNATRAKRTNVLQEILHVRGVHWIVTRLGGRKLRSLSFDEKFRSGDWTFSQVNPDLTRIVEKYCAGGRILVLGCGAAPIASALAPDSYETFCGLDISREAIALANRQANDKMRFEVGDMVRYRCSQQYDVILFSDSLYYVPWFARKKLLGRLRGNLTLRGRIVVAIAHPARYANILNMIRRNFSVEVDRTLDGTKRHIMVFS